MMYKTKNTEDAFLSTKGEYKAPVLEIVHFLFEDILLASKECLDGCGGAGGDYQVQQ